MQFKEGTHVFTSDGKNAGVVHRVVLDPRTDQLAGIVVRKGRLFTEDKVVPIDMVKTATDDRITLLETDADLHALPPFKETYFIPAYKDSFIGGPEPSSFVDTLYAYPPVGIAPHGSSDYMSYDMRTGPDYLSSVVENIPWGDVTLKEGGKVMDVDGKHAGDIHEVFYDDQTHRITHILLSKGILFKEHKLIPVDWIRVMGEDDISLTVPTRVVHDLPEYKPG
jgi:uncharacterized protein YrrD